MSTAMDRVRREQAVRSAALAVLEASLITGESLEAAAARFVREPSVRRTTGTSSTGAEIRYDWQYRESDIADIAAQARAFEQGART